jgi:hypothetical protein
VHRLLNPLGFVAFKMGRLSFGFRRPSKDTLGAANSARLQRSPKTGHKINDQRRRAKGKWHRVQKISAGISLVILSLGFSLLGLLLFANKPHADLVNVPRVGSASCIAGSAASLLAGTTFLVASCIYWRRYPAWRRPELKMS